MTESQIIATLKREALRTAREAEKCGDDENQDYLDGIHQGLCDALEVITGTLWVYNVDTDELYEDTDVTTGW